MSKKFIPVIAVLTLLSLFISYTSLGHTEGNDDPRIRYTKVLTQFRKLIDREHYTPPIFDDVFSKKLFKKFTETLDDDKDILLQSDISQLKKYATKIDDEIKGAPLESFFEINTLYLKRMNEASMIYKKILAKPFDFTIDEHVMLDPEKIDFPKSMNDREDIWRKRLKYAVLSKLVDMQEDREKNKDKKDYKIKADSTLEREAREQISKQMDRYFTTKKNRETQDENFSTFVNCITALMDPHTNYFPPVDLRSFNESMSGRFYGIGAQLKEEDGKIKITSLVSGGPAWKSGELKENDEILKVAQGNQEPVDVTGYSVSDAVKLIRGSEKGTEVRLTVKRMDGSIKVIRIIRDEVHLEETFAKSAIINGAHKVGYIYLPEFYADFERPNGARCAVDVAKEIEKLKEDKVEGIILDLRGNGGGSLYDVVQMVGLFIPDGPVCQVKAKSSAPNLLSDRDPRVQYDGPLAVMVDGTSASASEIFAAAIQDYKRGIIIGSSSTYGKGTVQRNISLNEQDLFNNIFSKEADTENLGAVKLTVQKFYRISGGATQRKGVIPDVVLPDRYDYLKYREKDNESALPWDEITKTSYTEWKNNATLDKVINQEKEIVSKNNTFSSIKNEVQLLEKYNDKEYQLQINKYKEEQKQLKLVYKQLDTLVKLSAPLVFTNLSADTAYINSSNEKEDKNKQWIKFRANDIYIDESVKAMGKLIEEIK